MDSLHCSIEGKLFTTLLNGLSKRLFFGEASLTNEYLANELYSSSTIPLDIAYTEINAFEQVLVKAAESCWDTTALEDKLKRLTNISEDHLKLLVLFWSHEKDKIHDKKVEQSRWNDSYNKMTWRLDAMALAKHASEAKEPKAIINLVTTSSVTKITSSIDIDMTRTELIELIEIFDTIQKKIDESSF